MRRGIVSFVILTFVFGDFSSVKIIPSVMIFVGSSFETAIHFSKQYPEASEKLISKS